MTAASGVQARHAVYALLWAGVLLFLVFPVKQDIEVTPPTQSLYEAIEALPRDKLVILSTSWDVGTRGESAPQTEAFIHHLFRSDIKFAIFGWAYPPGPTMAEQIAKRLARKYDKEYGVDWVNWGFHTGAVAMVMGLAKDIPGTIVEDLYHTPVSKVPVMRGVRDHRDVSMVIEITGSDSLPTWVQFWQGVYGTKLGYACTGVMVPQAFPYLDAKQIAGLQKGLVGSAEYERLMAIAGDGTTRMTAQSFAHILIILLIIWANVITIRAARRSQP